MYVLVLNIYIQSCTRESIDLYMTPSKHLLLDIVGYFLGGGVVRYWSYMMVQSPVFKLIPSW